MRSYFPRLPKPIPKLRIDSRTAHPHRRRDRWALYKSSHSRARAELRATFERLQLHLIGNARRLRKYRGRRHRRRSSSPESPSPPESLSPESSSPPEESRPSVLMPVRSFLSAKSAMEHSSGSLLRSATMLNISGDRCARAWTLLR